MVLLGRFLPRTEITLIVNVHAVSYGREIMLLRKLLHHDEQFIFAVKAARGIVARVLRLVQFRSLDDLERNVLLFRERNSILQVGAREARGICDHSQHIAAECLVRRIGQKSRVHPAGISHQSASHTRQHLVQLLPLGGYIHESILAV